MAPIRTPFPPRPRRSPRPVPWNSTTRPRRCRDEATMAKLFRGARARAGRRRSSRRGTPDPRKLGRFAQPCAPTPPSFTSWPRALTALAATFHLAGGAVRLSSAAGREMGARAPRGRRRRRRRARAGAPADVHARKERRKAVPHWAPPCPRMLCVMEVPVCVKPCTKIHQLPHTIPVSNLEAPLCCSSVAQQVPRVLHCPASRVFIR